MPLMAQNWYPTFGIITKVDGLSRLGTTLLALHESVCGLREVYSRDGA